MASHRRPTVVVLRALGLGDLLTGLPALRGLRQAWPEPFVVLATTPGVAALANVAHVADAVVAVPPLGPLPIAGPIEVAVNLHGRGPQSHRVLEALRPHRLIGFDLVDGPAWPEGCHEVERWSGLVDAMIAPAGGSVDRSALGFDLPGGPVPVDRSLTIVHPGASRAARRWPVRRWAEVVRFEVANGHQVVATGSEAEVGLCDAVVRLAGLTPSASRAGSTDVLDLARLVASAGRVVSGDTGVSHLATALDRPSITLFGPTDPAHWGPPPDRPHHVVLWAGSVGDPQGDEVDPGLDTIEPTEVCSALAALPDRQ